MTVSYEIRESVAWMTIERPEVLNAVRSRELRELLADINATAQNDSVRVLVITGTDRAFSVGSDIKAMDGMTEANFRAQTDLFQRLSQAMRDCDKPILAAINGYALGGGLEIALMCDVRIACVSAKLGLPDAELGFSPSGGLTWLLPRLIGQSRAMHLMLTGEMIAAREAERIGLVTMVVEDKELIPAVTDLANTMASWPSIGLANTKKGVAIAMDSDFSSALDSEAKLDTRSFQDPETKARLDEFLASRKK